MKGRGMATTADPAGGDKVRRRVMPIDVEVVRPRAGTASARGTRTPHASTRLSPSMTVATSTALGGLAGGIFLGIVFGPIGATLGVIGGLVVGELYDRGFVTAKRR